MSIRRRGIGRAIAGLAACALLAAGLFIAITGASAASQAVTVKNFAFSPATLNVSVGDTVTWTNQDSTAHTVTSDDDTSFNKQLPASGGTATITFTKAGTFTYHCSIHPNMHGTVIVAAASSATGSSAQTGGATATVAAPSTGSGTGSGTNSGPLFVLLGGILACLGLGAGVLAMQRR